MEKKFVKILGLMCITFLTFGYALATNGDTENTDITKLEDRLKSSGYKEISPVIIDSNGVEGITWEQAVIEQLCSGSGSWRNPYVIEDITINANGVGNCLFIENSDAFFIIRNCTMYNSGTEYTNAGIFLFNTANGIITNNTCYNNNMGIILWGECHNNTISENIAENNIEVGILCGTDLSYDNYIYGNTLSFNYHGIQTEGENHTISNNYAYSNLDRGIVAGGHSIIVTDNVAKNNLEGIFSPFGQDIVISGNLVKNNDHGIGLHICNNIVISGNTVSNSIWAGVKLWFSDNNIVSGNTLDSNQYGVSMYESKSNLISENFANYSDYGILLDYSCDDNNFTGNVLINNYDGIRINAPNCRNLFVENYIGDNENYGINLKYDINADNILYKNNFTGNALNAYDGGTNTQWDNGTIGNYWDDYGGVDFDDNGIGDTPYLIEGTAGSQDNYPIWDDGEDPPYDIIVNASGVSTNIKIDGFPYIGIGEIKGYDLDEGTYPVYSSPGGLIAAFSIDVNGLINYDPQYEGVTLSGAGTRTLSVLGVPINIDMRGVSTNISVFYFPDWLKYKAIETVYLPVNSQQEYKLIAGLGGQSVGVLDNTSFTVTSDGKVSYNQVLDGKTLNGLDTSTLEVIGYPISIDTSELSTNITLYGLKYWFDYKSIVTLDLPPDCVYPYRPHAGLGGYGIGRLMNASFKVTKEGEVSYDPFFDGKTLTGLGTSNVKILGYPINIDSRQLSTNITLYGLKYWFKFQDVETLILPPDTEYPYRPHSGLGGMSIGRLLNATFEVTKTGEVTYDPIFDGKTLNGLGTSTIEIIGYPITVDVSDVTSQVALFGMKHYIEFGGMETYILPPEVEYPYRFTTDLVGILEEGFIVRKDGTVTPTEIEFEYGTIRLYHDITPPTTTVSLSGVLGNNEWYISDVEITLTATDVSGIERIEYCIDTVNWIEYTGTFLITLEGITTLQFRSIDTIGNVEPINTIDIKIDKTLPLTELDMSRYYVDLSGNIYVSTSTEFTLNAFDESSGIESTFYRINGGPWSEYSDIFTLIGMNGPYTIEYYSIDNASHVELANSLTVNLVNFKINSYLSKGEGNPITYFDIIFTRNKQTGEYKLVATNPGQIFYIIEFSNNWPTSIETLDIEIIIPDDFLLKGTDPIYVYLDGIDITIDCLINGNLVTIQNIPSYSELKVVVQLEYELKGTTYPSLDDFGMRGYVFNSILSGISGDPVIIDDGLEQYSQTTASLITHQKKTTAIAGYVYDINGNVVEGALVELYLNGVSIKSIMTDENGFYYFIDIEEGIYEVKVTFGGMSDIQVATASKDELTELDFEINYENY